MQLDCSNDPHWPLYEGENLEHILYCLQFALYYLEIFMNQKLKTILLYS